MAKQQGPLFFDCTWGDYTFYIMEGEYYTKKKSSLTRERVLKDPAFAKTRLYAEQMGVASKIASKVYNQLPIGWRQKWMFEEFTGEAKIMLQQECSTEEIYNYLWKTYAEYWVLYQQATGVTLPVGRTAKKKKKQKTYKTIHRHRGSNDKYSRRYYNLLGKNHWKSKYDHTADLLAIDEKQQRKALNEAAWQRTLEKERRMKLINLPMENVANIFNIYPKPVNIIPLWTYAV